MLFKKKIIIIIVKQLEELWFHYMFSIPWL